MTTTRAVLIETKYAESAQTTQYTAPDSGLGCTIDKFTATNNGAGAESITVQLVPPGGTADVEFIVRTAKTLQVGEIYLFPEIVGQFLAPGGFISTIASAADTMTIRAGGREDS